MWPAVVVIMCRMALKYYEDNAVSGDDVFKLSVPSSAISAHLSKYVSISARCATMLSLPAGNDRECQYNWHRAGSLGWLFPLLKSISEKACYQGVVKTGRNVSRSSSNKIYRSNFIRQHSETVMV